jgi:hypothetical protein
MKRYEKTVSAAVPFSEASYSEPSRAASVGADFVVPVLQAVFSGVVALALVRVVASWRVAGVVALVVLAVVWALLLVDHRRLLWAVESLTGVDLDGDERAGQPASRLTLEVKQGNGKRFDYIPLDVSEETFLTWARAVLGGHTLAVASWVGRGRPFSRGQYDAMMSSLEAAGIVRQDSGGRVLSPAGRAALRACVRVYAGGADSTNAQDQE